MKYEFKVELKNVWHREKKVVPPKPNATTWNLRKSLLLAHQINKYMEDNDIGSLHEISKLLDVSRARITQIMQLLLLAPDIQQEAIFSDNSKIQKLTERRVRRIAMVAIWENQEKLWCCYSHTK
ncbi:MAG: hypothetical protein WCQ47_06830 [bacterium]